jgi:hypothetical protein
VKCEESLSDVGLGLCGCAQNVWQEVLRCVSRWELLQQIASGGPTDAHLFAAPAEPAAPAKRRNFFSMRRDAGARPLPSPLCCESMSRDMESSCVR